MTARGKLRDAIERRLIPALKARGFTGADRINGNRVSHEYRRPRGAYVEFVSIQFEKRQRPRFVLNLWIEPPEGREAIIARGGVSIQGRIIPNRGVLTWSWFRADRPLWQRLLGRTSTLENRAIEQALSFLDAIEDWFREPRDTAAVRTSRIDWGKVRDAKEA